jgi:hypothetical protein
MGLKHIFQIREVNCLLSGNGIETISLDYLRNKNLVDDL